MTTSSLIRTVLIGGSLAAAMSANAVLILVDSVGHAVGASSNDIFFSENVLAQDGGFGHFDHLFYEINLTGPDVTGSGEYFGHHGDMDFSFSYDDGSFSGAGGSLEGTWTYTGGTGNYAGLAGGGTLALTGQVDTFRLDTITSLQGSLQAVPEPAPIAALGIGAIGLLRRRRKA